MRSKQFGGRLTSQWKSVYASSPNWKDGSFKNLVQTETAISWRRLPGIICKQLEGHPEGQPRSPLPVIPLDVELFLAPSQTSKFAWFGHSAILMRINNRTIFIDPMLGDDASPIAPTTTKRFSNGTLSIIDTLPPIDLVVITHDHYDHLDYGSILRLKEKTALYHVALGVKRHLISWGIAPECVIEFDWWDHRMFDDIEITFTPTRHFSGRGLTSISKCLWGGWVFKTPSESIWFSGDSGYADHFIEIGARLGPFDFAMMECGQYCVDWPQIHMFPEESVQAAIDAMVNVAMPVHWAGFKLSYQHAWYEPAEEFLKFAGQKGLEAITPGLGVVFDTNATIDRWWNAYR